MNANNPYAPPRASVQDIADPDTPALLAARGTRLAATFLDSIIFSVMAYVPLLIGVRFNGLPLASAGHFNPAALFGMGSLVGLSGLIVWAWLTVLFVTRNGQSIGKRITQIKVVRSDGSPASLSRIFWLRNAVNIGLSMIPLYGLVDALVIFGEPRQCLHDKIADTIVIKA
jgi:uncharacterized RDD family membrane protein YckC